MKTLEELKELTKKWKENHKNDVYYEDGNFASYNYEDDRLIVFASYEQARNFAEQGGPSISH